MSSSSTRTESSMPPDVIWRSRALELIQESPSTAVFLADKAFLVSRTPENAIVYAKCLYANGEYDRALRFISGLGFLTSQSPSSLATLQESICTTEMSVKAVLISAMCYYARSKHRECLKLLEKLQRDYIPPKGSPSQLCVPSGALWLIRGKSNNALEKRSESIRCWKNALECDPMCAEAWQLLTSSHALDSSEWDQLYQDTKKNMNCSGADILLTFYAASTVEAGTDFGKSAVQLLSNKNSSVQVHAETITSRARVLLRQYQYVDALHVIKVCISREGIASVDEQALLVYIGCLMQLKRKDELAAVAQELSTRRIDKPITWYAMGCFWMMQKEYEAARTSFAKATTANPSFACAWLMFGNSFAVCGEHDQAIASYRTVMRLYKASHIPLLCLGQEMIAIANFEDALQFLDRAKVLCDDDPLIYNEYGVAAFQRKDYSNARKNLEIAEKLLNTQMDSAVVELVNNNLAHVLRCLHEYDEALEHLRKCLTLAGGRHRRASVLSSMAYVHHITGDYLTALTEYHQSLALQPDNTLVSDLLNLCLEDAFRASVI